MLLRVCCCYIVLWEYLNFINAFDITRDDKLIKIWAVEKTETGAELEIADYETEVTCIDWHPCRGLILSGAKDGLVKLHDPRQRSCVRSVLKNEVFII